MYRPSCAARHSLDPVRRLKAVPALTWGVREGEKRRGGRQSPRSAGDPIGLSERTRSDAMLHVYILSNCWLVEGGEFLPGRPEFQLEALDSILLFYQPTDQFELSR